jgi:hypothetical protein
MSILILRVLVLNILKQSKLQRLCKKPKLLMNITLLKLSYMVELVVVGALR